MASDILHIKDGYYFEVPKMFWRSNRAEVNDFPGWMVRLDDDYQAREADAISDGLRQLEIDGDDISELRTTWEDWRHADHKNAGWPMDAYLEQYVAKIKEKAASWKGRNAPSASDATQAYLAAHPDVQHRWFFKMLEDPKAAAKWSDLKAKVNSNDFLEQYKLSDAGKSWSREKIAEYNHALDGKIMIPQPFGTLRNAHEAESGFCISRYMVVEVVVALLLFFAFRWLAKRINSGTPPKGKSWNLLEGFVQAVRDKIVVPAMGEHDADRFMPFLWTMFFFILGCNLMGMLPWIGAPTASFGTTAALAFLVFIVGLAVGVQALGLVGYLKNICPSLGLPWYLSFWLVPALWLIEALSLLIKHAVLAVRLLMNMGAGHLVLLGILGIGISAKAAMELSNPAWFGVAGISVLGTTLMSFLEVFVAFLQAYVFTFLAAMFIGSSMHHH
jgi:F-type H+-transporting ATPase subunit a